MKKLLKTKEDYSRYVQLLRLGGYCILSEPPKKYPCVAIYKASWMIFVYLDDFNNEKD
jgi:hypothetical protein